MRMYMYYFNQNKKFSSHKYYAQSLEHATLDLPVVS